eukprot:CAMPEP_0201530360 /NCGR_PEP_ID=MMETSP0161_2-20130828/44432_1 /ASSEMBLY_ACC=CAM_ASM_000251 /TAXON_ID=180227 /ORGANISM="Neoparamoeba aestuarina, Strain SoJaBio B1-5/56/2" /LENGTH=44 /DNA_ID= /DNA_START= /DNA_END= /DNA_ORIENTATION=
MSLCDLVVAGVVAGSFGSVGAVVGVKVQAEKKRLKEKMGAREER